METVTPTLTTLLDDIEKGLVCLVPKSGSGITCHEKSVCDCTVLKLVSALRVAREALETVAHAEKFVEHIDHNFRCAIDASKTAITHLDELFEKEKT